MAKLKFEIDSELVEDKHISAFAFNSGRMIEELINDRTNQINDINIHLQSKILKFYSEIPEGEFKEKYKNYFNISSNI